MSEDFIRHYIGNVHFQMLENFQQESGKFNEWKLLQGSEFDYKHSYGYKENFIQDELLLEELAKRSVIAEARQPDSLKPSKFWKYKYGGSIFDVLTLLSLARAEYCPISATEEKRGNKHSIIWDLMPRDVRVNYNIVPIDNLGGFIAKALTYIENNPSWLKASGFIPSIYMFTQAQRSCLTAPSILEMGLYWVSLEILAGTYIDTKGMYLPRKRDRVKCFISDKGYTGNIWVFLDEVIDDWYIARNDLFHEGTEKLPIELLAKRGKQIRDFTSLVFVEMLQKQEDARKSEIATRMQNY